MNVVCILIYETGPETPVNCTKLYDFVISLGAGSATLVCIGVWCGGGRVREVSGLILGNFSK